MVGPLARAEPGGKKKGKENLRGRAERGRKGRGDPAKFYSKKRARPIFITRKEECKGNEKRRKAELPACKEL